MPRAAALLALISLSACGLFSRPAEPADDPRLQVGFLLLDGIYGSELVAPHDVFQHTVFHTEPGMRVFTVGRSHRPVTSFEGLVIVPDYSLDDAPRIDVLVVPSAEHNLDTDLDDARLIDWVRRVGEDADHLLSICDGAFVLAQAGLLEQCACTTFPSDIGAFRERFPQLDVREDVTFVVDGKAITGVGGAKSYEPAFWLVEHLYGAETARNVGKGLVIDWRLEDVPHVVNAAPDGR